MDNKTVKYIIDYYSKHLTDDEKMAIKHTNSLYNLQQSGSEKALEEMYYKRGWLTSDQTVLDLLKDGYESFALKAAGRVLQEHKVFLNNCPKCNQLARTPYARQCRCGYSWHYQVVAEFLFKNSFQLRDRHFFIFGEMINGVIQKGDLLDLSLAGLNCKPEIKAIEFALKRENGKAWEDIALGIEGLSDNEKSYLTNSGALGISVDIVRKR